MAEETNHVSTKYSTHGSELINTNYIIKGFVFQK
jgi:hypothetical protein